eukprot:154624_1
MVPMRIIMRITYCGFDQSVWYHERSLSISLKRPEDTYRCMYLGSVRRRFVYNSAYNHDNNLEWEQHLGSIAICGRTAPATHVYRYLWTNHSNSCCNDRSNDS